MSCRNQCIDVKRPPLRPFVTECEKGITSKCLRYRRLTPPLSLIYNSFFTVRNGVEYTLPYELGTPVYILGIVMGIIPIREVRYD